MFRITLSTHSLNDYVSVIYAGLYDLENAGQVKLDYADKRGLLAKGKFGLADLHNTVVLNITDDTSSKSAILIIEVGDSTGINEELVQCCDVFVKRSYCAEVVAQLSPALQKKVVPFGLHFACTSVVEKSWHRLRHVHGYNTMKGHYATTPIKSVLRLVRHVAELTIIKRGRAGGRLPMLSNTMTVPPTRAAEEKIYYRTRVYDQDSARVENQMRVDVIRALKGAFGSRFVGGLRRTPFAEKHYPDCIFAENIDWQGHLERVRRYLVCVTSSGLHGSNDWKIAEYLAASRCLVSQQLKSEPHMHLQHGREALFYTNPAGCVESCQAILSDPELASQLRHNAAAYFSHHGQPKMLLSSCLERVEPMLQALS